MRLRYLNNIGLRLLMGFLVVFMAIAFIFLLTTNEFRRIRHTLIDLVEHHIVEVRLFSQLEHTLVRIRATLDDIARDPDQHEVKLFQQQLSELDNTVDAILDLETRFPDVISPDATATSTAITEAMKRQAEAFSDLQPDELNTDMSKRIIESAASLVDSLLQQASRLSAREDLEIQAFATEIERRSSAAVAKITAISLSVTFVSALIAVSLVLSITRPIKHLADITRKVADGDLSLRSNVDRGDEIGLLSRAFDNMVSRLEQILNEQKQFLADTSHELLTPVTVIKGHLQVMDRLPAVPERERRDTFQIIFSELDKIERTLSALLHLARSSSRDLLTFSPVHVPSFLGDIFRRAEGLAKRNWSLGEAPEVNIMADRDLFSSAILNLLRNAVAHTREGDKITLSFRLVDEGLEFAVSDTGCGIAEKDIPKIFDRFYRGGNLADSSSGSGLGLSIVKAVAEAHGGRVSVISQVGKGSTFYIWLPLNVERPS